MMLEEWLRTWNSDGGERFRLKGRGKYLLVIVICFGILALLWPVTKTDNNKTVVPASGSQEKTNYAVNEQMSSTLAGILAKISGAGKVEVSLTLASDGAKTYATNDRNEKRTVEEKDGKGSNKVTSEENITHDLATTANNPLLLESKTPEVIGVLVVAEGAADAVVRENLTNATATLLNIPSYKIRVMPREGKI